MIKPDSPLSERIHLALEGIPSAQRRRLRVETLDKRVILRGVVGSYYQKQMAQEALRRLDGVDEVENELEVQWA